MIKKFVNIKVAGEGNIGVIDLGKINPIQAETKNATIIRSRVESKMVEALRSHFDCEVRVISVNVISSVGHIEVKADVIIASEEQDYQEEVVMEETWVY